MFYADRRGFCPQRLSLETVADFPTVTADLTVDGFQSLQRSVVSIHKPANTTFQAES